MPIYDYLCLDCGRSVEELRDVKDVDRPASCPCGGKAGRVMPRTFSIRCGKSSPTSQTQSGEHVYDPTQRCPLPSYARHLTPDQYEAKCEKSFAAAAERAKRMVRDKVMDSDHDHVGRIPAAEFLARWKQGGKEGAMDIDYWKAKGRVFEHGKRRIKKQG